MSAIIVERRDHVLWLTVNRPEARNALTAPMWEELHAAARVATSDPELRAVVICGAGGKAFIAGADIGSFRSLGSGADAVRYEEGVDVIMTALEGIPIPTIAAITGACTGGGASIAATCDLRIGTPSTRVGYPVARTLGNCLSQRNYARLVAIVGASAVKEMVFTARLIGAERAKALGFLNEIVGETELLGRAAALADAIAANAPLTLRATKEALRRITRVPAEMSADLLALCYGSNDFQSGMHAFLEKRPAVWEGR